MMRFAGLATAFALTACAWSPPEENAQAERRRERAQRHGRLALAYLSHQRPDVAREEAAAALALTPGDPQALHAAALADLASGRLPVALPRLAAAAQAVVTTPGWRDDAHAGVILSNYAAALCAAGRGDDARQWRRRAAEAGGVATAVPEATAQSQCATVDEVDANAGTASNG